MQENIKQRLIGIAVITSLAAIFIPMLFEGNPPTGSEEITALQLPILPPADPPPVPQIPKSLAIPPPLDVQTIPETQKAPPPKSKPHIGQSWFIQLGSFSQESNAIALQKIIHKQGFPAVINTKLSQKRILYSVQAGPVPNKKRAQSMKIKIDKLNNTNGILLQHN